MGRLGVGINIIGELPCKSMGTASVVSGEDINVVVKGKQRSSQVGDVGG